MSQLPESTLQEASEIVWDMLSTSTAGEESMEPAPAVSVLQIIWTLLNGSSTSVPESRETTSLAGKDVYLPLLADVGKALAVGAEDSEELAEISVGHISLKAAKLGRASPAQTTLFVGQNATRILVTNNPDTPITGGNESSTVIFTVAAVSSPESG
ncbi:unnamed protein product, partial [Sphacelaria rigidula]